MNSRRLISALSLAFAVALPSDASAQLAANQWYVFQFGAIGTPAFRCTSCTVVPGAIKAPAATLWTYASGTAFDFTVQDLYSNLSRFEVFANATSLGLTSVAGSGICGGTIAACIADPNSSRGTFLLGPGSYTFSIQNLGASEQGIAVFQVSSPSTVVPEPSTVALMAAGLAFLGVGYRRRSA